MRKILSKLNPFLSVVKNFVVKHYLAILDYFITFIMICTGLYLFMFFTIIELPFAMFFAMSITLSTYFLTRLYAHLLEQAHNKMLNEKFEFNK